MNGVDRASLVRYLRAEKQKHAEAITKAILRKNPTWVERFGDAALSRGIEDTAYHIDFLASAIEIGEPDSFREYVRWAARSLACRGIEPEMLAESLRVMSEMLTEKLDEKQARVVREIVAAAAAECTDGVAEPADPREKLNDLQSAYLQAILAGERRGARKIALDALDAGLGFGELYEDVLQECMYAIGELWETNRINVADEHMATAITQSVMAEIYEHVPWTYGGKGRVVLTGVEGELHQVGAHLVADALDIQGWDVRFLGTNVPHRDVLRTVAEHGADILGISATMLVNVTRVKDLVEQTREQFGDDVRVIVGGGAFRTRPELWKRVGADACGLNLGEAAEQLDRLAG